MTRTVAIKRIHEEKARFQPTFAPGYYVFIERPLLNIAAAELIATQKLLEMSPQLVLMV